MEEYMKKKRDPEGKPAESGVTRRGFIATVGAGAVAAAAVSGVAAEKQQAPAEKTTEPHNKRPGSSRQRRTTIHVALCDS